MNRKMRLDKCGHYLLKKKVSILLFLLVSLNACGIFLSPYSPQSYKYFTQLKVNHLKFIEVFTKGSGIDFDEGKINNVYNQIDILFREAIEYEKLVTNDKTRLDAFELLYEQFNADYKFLINSSKLFGKVFSEELRKEVAQNYDLAIAGELSRRDSPNN